jgi:ABC-2 type transport system ATP-binding protein
MMTCSQTLCLGKVPGVLQAIELTKSYGDRIVVDGMSFTAPDGKVTGFLGPNGAGKTTTFRVMLGLAHPTAGRGLVDGKPYASLDAPRRRVGAVLESSGFHPGRSGRDHLRVVARAAGIDQHRVDEMLDFVGLGKAGTRRVGGYSMGMRQRLALATALLGDPSTLVLDEPTNGLDPDGIRWLRQQLRGWAAEGRCVVVSSHLLAEVAQAVDHVVIINHGRIAHETNGAMSPPATLVRCADPQRLAGAIRTMNGTAQVDGDVVRVTGLDSTQLGNLAAQASIAVYEMRTSDPAAELEELFINATGPEPSPVNESTR